MRVAYLTGGTIGVGHLMHGMAIQRGLKRTGVEAELRMFGPDLPFAVNLGELGYTPLWPRNVAIDPGPILPALRAYQPDLLLVDLAWRMAIPAIETLELRSWLLLRKVPPQWTRDLPASVYERIIGIEPDCHPSVREEIDPLVVCEPEEQKPREALRTYANVPSGTPLHVAIHAGIRGEIWTFAPPGKCLILDLHQQSLFPAAEWLNGADAIYTGAGYCTFWESKRLGFYDRTRFTPLLRPIDDQHWRVRTFADYTPKGNGANQLAEMIQCL